MEAKKNLKKNIQKEKKKVKGQVKQKKKYDDILTDKSGLRNRETNVISVCFVLLFLSMIVYLCVFNIRDAKKILGNSYNKLIDAQSEKVVRGDILAYDGTVLATTKTNDNGEEYRYYPYDDIFCHSIGFSSTFLKTGVEKSENYYLLSETDNIFDQISVDISGEKAKGHNVYTTLDFEISKAAYDALGNKKGAVIAMEPSTGRLLCMVSNPSFNPNTIEEDYESLLLYDSKDSVLLNRASQGLYPPGSTFKILTTLEYLRENKNYTDYLYDCSGSAYVNGGTTIPCYDSKVHGEEDLKTAFANSCNAAFSTIGSELDKEGFRKLCDDFLFNSTLPVDFEYSESLMSVTKDSLISEMQETGIGQGKTMISPLHNLMITSTIANKGVMMKPYMVDKIDDAYGRNVLKYQETNLGRFMTEEEAEYLSDCMREVVTYGTGYAFSNSSYEAAGKTGSAQYDNSKNHHSWFVGFAPYSNPKIAICVILEGEGRGGVEAQYVAKSVLDAFFG